MRRARAEGSFGWVLVVGLRYCELDRPQAGRVVGIRVAAGNREYTLCQELMQSMIDLARLPLILKTPGHTADQPIASLGRLQQECAAIGTALPLIELHDDRLGENLRE